MYPSPPPHHHLSLIPSIWARQNDLFKKQAKNNQNFLYKNAVCMYATGNVCEQGIVCHVLTHPVVHIYPTGWILRLSIQRVNVI